jgi:calpain-15
MARILYRGVLREVVVDDFLPVDKDGKPVFSKASGGIEIWVMILEKCWAKLHGSYGAIIGGLPFEVLHAFSGAPTSNTNIPKTQKGWDELW